MTDAGFLLARACLSALFIVSGIGKFMAVAGVSGMLASKGFPQPMLLGYLVAALELFGGIMILVGFKARYAALALAIFCAATIIFFHNFWTMDGPARAQNQLAALKNLGILGGFLLLWFTGPGRYSVDRR